MVQQASMAGLSKSMAGAVLLGAAMLAAPSQGRAQAAYEVMPLQQIPRSYDSWSLFLVCNPAWLLENGDRGIAELFRAYKAFGQAIGPKNLAIWFWKAPAMTPTLENTDIGRMSEYCQKYRLTPSDTPQVVATTRKSGRAGARRPGRRQSERRCREQRPRADRSDRPAPQDRAQPIRIGRQRPVAPRGFGGIRRVELGRLLFQQGFDLDQDRRLERRAD